MKKWKKLTCILLAATTAFSLCACGGDKKDDTTDASTEKEETKDLSAMSYDEQSSYIYDQVLGEFYDAYQVAQEAEDIDE